MTPDASSPPRRALSLVVSALALLSLVHCSGVPAGGTLPRDGGTTEPDGAQCTGSSSQPGDRPSPISCPVSASVYPDAGDIACKVAGDCPAASELYGCIGGRCTFDECFTDADCATGTTCACASELRGNLASQHSVCVPAQCRVNADCGKAGICSPSGNVFCEPNVSGYYCHSSADTCTTNADCCADPSKTQCLYDQALGHFDCQGVLVCSG